MRFQTIKCDGKGDPRCQKFCAPNMANAPQALRLSGSGAHAFMDTLGTAT